jgi:ABC-type uncharacterized transport system involved in gliding motility auxiliary subunit
MRVNQKELFKAAGLLGAALLAVGYYRYSVNETLTTPNKVILIAGAVLLVAGLILNFNGIRSFFGRRSSRLGTNTAVLTVAVVGIIGVVNFLGYRHHKRIDLTTEKLYSLSDQTRKIVSSLDKDVAVMKFAKEDDQTLKDRLQEYRDLSKHITYEYIDPQVKPEKAKQYKITPPGETIVVSGSRTERLEEPTEQALTNAILKVTREKLKKICFVEGHGEKKIASKNEGDGYGVVDGWLKNENYETSSLNLVGANQVPPDCDVLVLAGPKQPLFPQEGAMIGKYLESGGKAMLLLDPDVDTHLGDVLRSWGIEVGNDTVVDVSGVGRLFGTGPAVPLARTYGTHAITKDFAGSMTFFPFARSVTTLNSGSDATTTDLLKTSDESWAETELKGNEVAFNEGKDKKGPITLGVAATRTIGDKDARLVVIGDSDFATNEYAGLQRNGDLFMNSANWLAQDEELISIRPKNPTDRKVTMTASQQNTFFWLSLVFMPVAVIGSGVYIWWKRR